MSAIWAAVPWPICQGRAPTSGLFGDECVTGRAEMGRGEGGSRLSA